MSESTGEKTSATGNISKARRERLIGEVAAIRAFLERNAGADTNSARLLSFAADLEREVRGKKFGLVFEEHRERVDVELEENIPVLEEVRERFVSRGGAESAEVKEQTDLLTPNGVREDVRRVSDEQIRVSGNPPLNFLIEGDNLAALKLLEKTHRGKIDLIYIDPPYNTGNKDFIYNDSYVDKTDTFRHSKWLSFMRKRLEIAKRLMSDKGVIFISIDDNEQAALRLLCDEIFGEGNFITQIAWRRTDNQSNLSNVAKVKEYVLCYSKNARVVFGKLPLSEKAAKEYRYKDDKGFFRRAILLDKTRGRKWFPVKTKSGGILNGPWMVTEEEFRAMDARGEIYWTTGGDEQPYGKIYKSNSKGQCPNDFWGIEFGTNQRGSLEVEAILGKRLFDFPKPVSLVASIIRIATMDASPTILDFFAGSGTTGHAVMKLNAEDGGRRKFILVTNNENGICEKVTYERLRRVIEKEGYAASLKYFRIGYVPIGEDGYWEMADALLGHIRELVELENGIDFAHDSSVAIVLTDEEAKTFVAGVSAAKNAKRAEGVVRVLYKGHNVMLGAKARAALERLGIEVRTIPDYYYPELEG